MKAALESVGHYTSGPGGADHPAVIPPNVLLFELITEGSVYSPGGSDLHGPGAVFAHSPGQSTVSRTPGDGHYACMTARYRLDLRSLRFAWHRVFQWAVVSEALRFSEEILFAFHHTDLDRAVLGDLIWSQFRFRLEEFRRSAKHRAIPPLVAGVMGHMDRHFAEPLGVEGPISIWSSSGCAPRATSWLPPEPRSNPSRATSATRTRKTFAAPSKSTAVSRRQPTDGSSSLTGSPRGSPARAQLLFRRGEI